MTNAGDIGRMIDDITSFEEINQIQRVLNARRTYLSSLLAHNVLSVGQRVKFVSKGVTHRGVITKIMQKNIKVQVGYVTWTCSPSFLQLDNAEELAG